jgi:FO synthase
MAAPIYLQRKARRGPTFREALLVHAIGRIAYHGWIPNIQVSWVKMSREVTQACLRAGANDYGGTLMNENISREAGSQSGEYLAPEEFRARIRELGRVPAERTTLYKIVQQYG